MDPTQTVEKVSDTFLNQGTLGAVVILLLIAVSILWREVKAEREARIGEMKESIDLAREMRETVETVVSAVKGRGR